MLLHVIALFQLGIGFKEAIYDSLISNILLGAASILIALSLQYYLPQKSKFLYLLGFCTILTLLWLFFSNLLINLIFDELQEHVFFFKESVVVRGMMGFLIIGCMALICVLWYTILDQQEMQRRKTETERMSKDAELYMLRQQLQPHFLFNSLNSINALIGTQPEKARNMIHQLSAFLRGTLRKEEQWVSLEEELKHLQLYLEIEKLRFGHRLTTNIVNSSSGETRLPPMLLQPIVENAIKFGLYDTTEAISIDIDAWTDDSYLIIQVKNPFDPATSAPRKGTGFGLNSINRRLYLLFTRNDLLKTEVAGNIFVTTIKIPQPK